MLTCGQNQHQNTVTVFQSNSQHVFLEILLFISSGSKQMSKMSDQRTCQAIESMSWMATEYLNYSGGKNERKEVDSNRNFILKIRVLNFISFFFFCPQQADLNSSTRAWTQAPLQWKCGVLTSGLPGQVPRFIFLIILSLIEYWL